MTDKETCYGCGAKFEIAQKPLNGESTICKMKSKSGQECNRPMWTAPIRETRQHRVGMTGDQLQRFNGKGAA